MPRIYAVLFALIAVAWTALVVAAFPDGLSTEADPYGYRLLFAHALAPGLVVPVALFGRVRRHLTTAQTAAVVVAPLVGFAVLLLTWSVAGHFASWVDVLSSSALLYLNLSLVWCAVVGLIAGAARVLSRRTAA